MPSRRSLDRKIKELDEKREILKAKRKKGLPIIAAIGISIIAISISIFNSFPAIVFSSVLGLMFSFISYTLYYQYPFNELKHELRDAFVEYFMEAFHPNIHYEYIAKEHKGGKIARSTDLISFNRSKEEDVITGHYKNVEFYISEMKLQRKSKDNTSTVFKGILFRLRLYKKNFPKSSIITRQSFLNKLISKYNHNEEFGFRYQTEDESAFDQKLSHLFPFIQHLAQKEGKLRINIENDEITVLMETDMAFLDEPAPSIASSFDNPEYFDNASKQINTLLYIVEAFADSLDKNEIQESLELKSLEIIREIKSKH